MVNTSRTVEADKAADKAAHGHSEVWKFHPVYFAYEVSIYFAHELNLDAFAASYILWRTTMISEIRADLDSGILTITLSRPDKKDALTNEMYGALADTIEKAQQDSNIRVVLLQADGDSFTAGNDLGEFAAIASGKGPSERHVQRFLHAMANSTVPIVAAVHGNAVASAPPCSCIAITSCSRRMRN